MRRSTIKALGALLTAIMVASCGSSTDEPTLTFTGTWKGTFGTASTPFAVTWTATQTGSAVAGPALVVVSPVVSFTGTITGTLSNGQLALAIAVPAGAIAAIPACSITGAGQSTTATSSSIVASILVTFSQACLGTVTTQASSTATLTLTK